MGLLMLGQIGFLLSVCVDIDFYNHNNDFNYAEKVTTWYDGSNSYFSRSYYVIL